ncbi:AraC family transcriptional regulator [Bradyrhizobium sp.]|uniref:helix-turn-helix domain-containing protein n=1 Tax=Bradyrhizobium sp. TaxID=376 RepID=UPI002720966A|nr:AraC family transcriptional regulator [Bradyrhizobium sp.]MDO9295046.1 AraC family transcriptional regulator [Bradyrhizobium sp.]
MPVCIGNRDEIRRVSRPNRGGGGFTRLQRDSVTTADTILQIASDVGYESESAFDRAFKMEFGLPPAQYRKKYRTLRNGQPAPGRHPFFPGLRQMRPCRDGRAKRTLGIFGHVAYVPIQKRRRRRRRSTGRQSQKDGAIQSLDGLG